jgi:multisubunit Na+/H+ antiporter MnhG subunit
MLKILASTVLWFFLVCWVVFLLQQLGLIRLPDLSRLTLIELYTGTSILGWLAGLFYVQSTRHKVAGRPRRQLLLESFFGPLGLVFLGAAAARLTREAPLAAVWALCVYGIFYCIPVSFRSVGRDRRA